MNDKTAPNCPCAKTSCPRHGNCRACMDRHRELNTKTACQKLFSMDEEA